MVPECRWRCADNQAHAEERPRRDQRDRIASGGTNGTYSARARGSIGGRGQRRSCSIIGEGVGCPPRDIVLAAGASGRLKCLVISGDGPTLVAALERLSKTG